MRESSPLNADSRTLQEKRLKAEIKLMSNLIEMSAIREAAERYRVTVTADYFAPPIKSRKSGECRECCQVIAHETQRTEVAA